MENTILTSLHSQKPAFNYIIKRTPRRKTIAIYVSRNLVEVAAPKQVSNKEIHEIVLKKQNWINKKLDFYANNSINIRPKEYMNGEIFSFLGHNYRLLIKFDEAKSASLTEDYLIIKLPINTPEHKTPTLIQSILKNWYKEQALHILTDKSNRLACFLNRQIKQIKLRITKTKWGHCTTDGIIQYNWHIICAPEHIVDYLVTHEVCHLIHHNHSKEYWQLVESICPDYKEQRKWLNTHSPELFV